MKFNLQQFSSLRGNEWNELQTKTTCIYLNILGGRPYRFGFCKLNTTKECNTVIEQLQKEQIQAEEEK